jgi:hypothetical protein
VPGESLARPEPVPTTATLLGVVPSLEVLSKYLSSQSVGVSGGDLCLGLLGGQRWCSTSYFFVKAPPRSFQIAELSLASRDVCYSSLAGCFGKAFTFLGLLLAFGV